MKQLLALLISLSTACLAQDATALPVVKEFACPKFPPKAASDHLQGMVKLKVTTDGHRVSDVRVESGHPALRDDAVKNVETWVFADHTPTSWAVTYFYVHEGRFKRDKATNCDAKMELPKTVTVSTSW